MSGDSEAPLRLRAPAKINWSLEVLRKQPDGYHEVRTVLQTIALSDWLTLTPAHDVSLQITGEAFTRAARALAEEPPESNLAYRAAELLRETAGAAAGVRIELEKRVPVAAGLGGGSSDAAAVLRGLRKLWRLSTDAIDDAALAAVAADLGSDVPFFLRGGLALASGRGTELTPLPDSPRQRLLVAWPERSASGDKTARMYAALRSEHFSDGTQTEQLVKRLVDGAAVRDNDIVNVFERLLPEVDKNAAQAFSAARATRIPHLAGSGPALFFLLSEDEPATELVQRMHGLGLRAVETHTLSTAEAQEETPWPR
ncbi:MAG: 4-(cytidine 5'-diphospho)-2-C-methyl-D-erythritol kinase [Chloroflexi bacterium]|nr:4-(cytidine 5'-diphospho)-2-C-methyl-D-erythritol kinase [Chloroflexota bacterium]